jgi:hypothetical protein
MTAGDGNQAMLIAPSRMMDIRARRSLSPGNFALRVSMNRRLISSTIWKMRGSRLEKVSTPHFSMGSTMRVWLV